MREIKFRAWDGMQMHYDFQWLSSGNEGNDWIVFTSDKQKFAEKGKTPACQNPYFYRQLKKLEWTGLQDSNGVDIYESDICRVMLSSGNKVTAFVHMNDGCYDLEFISPLVISGVYKTRDYLKCHTCNHAVEIIGNTFMNPELLQN